MLSTLPILLSGALLVAAAPTEILESRQSWTNCTTGNAVHMIVVYGLTEAGYGFDTPLVAAVQQLLPGSDATSVKYPASNVFPPYNIAVDIGAANTIKEIQEYVDSCPNSKISLLGYSQGAQVAMDAVCGTSSAGYIPSMPLAPKYASHMSSIVNFGDPSFVYPQPFDKGTATSSGIFPRLNNQPCLAYGKRLQNYCDAGDPDCAGALIGGNENVHHNYFNIYTNAAAAFVKQMATS